MLGRVVRVGRPAVRVHQVRAGPCSLLRVMRAVSFWGRPCIYGPPERPEPPRGVLVVPVVLVVSWVLGGPWRV